jgi:hypothetical protein
VWIAAVLAVALFGHAAEAQREPAGRSEPPDYVRIPVTGDQEEILKRLLQQAEQRRKLEEILELIQRNPEQLPIDLDMVKKLQASDDPGIKKQIAEFKNIFEKQILPGLDQKKAADLRKALGKLELPAAKDNGKPPVPPPAGSGVAPGAAPSGAPPATPADAEGEEPDGDAFADWFKERMKDLAQSDLRELFQDSPAFRDALLDLERMRNSPDAPQFGLDWRDLARRAEGLPLPKEKLPLPNLQGWNWDGPRLDRLSPTRGFRMFPRMPGGPHVFTGGRVTPTGDISGVGPLAVILVAAALLGAAAWALLFAFPWSPLRRKGAAGAKHLSWPVDPARISTAAELIAAFNHLALLLFGAEARSWNHRDVARQIGDDGQPERERQAAELAAVYEQARYAPEEPLGPAELETARRCLTSLAGVAAS